MKVATSLVALALGLTAAGCESGAGASTNPLPAAALSPSVDNSYRLGPGDKLRLITFGEERLSGEFTVNELGRVAIPLVGDIKAGGATLEQFQASVQKALENGFLKNPRVSVEVLNYRPYYILGEVNKPGEYPFTNGLTVTNAVATAGGFTYRANIHKVFFRGPNEIKEHVLPLTGQTPVHPGDTVRIPERLF